MTPMLIPCSRSPHDQNVLARRPQWDQHRRHSTREKQASLEGTCISFDACREGYPGYSPYRMDESRRDRSSQAAQKVIRQDRRRVETGSVPSGGYVEDFDEPRTKLEGFFSSRLSGETGGLPIDHPHSSQDQCDAKDFAHAHRFVQ